MDNRASPPLRREHSLDSVNRTFDAIFGRKQGSAPQPPQRVEQDRAAPKVSGV